VDRKPVKGGAARYREFDLASRTEGATPHALVAMLYLELQIALQVLGKALERDDSALLASQHERANTILAALEGGLDKTGGQEFAIQLAHIYRQMRHRLSVARSGDQSALDEVEEGVGNLAEAWNAIAR
jgi:flagellar secretion chaperone FliS